MWDIKHDKWNDVIALAHEPLDMCEISEYFPTFLAYQDGKSAKIAIRLPSFFWADSTIFTWHRITEHFMWKYKEGNTSANVQIWLRTRKNMSVVFGSSKFESA